MPTQYNATNDPKDTGVKHSDPIPILSTPFRRRSASVSSCSSSSASSTSEIPTPISGSGNSHPISIPSPSSSPILSYFLAQSPTTAKSATAATFPFKNKFGTAPVFEEPEQEQEVPVAAHARRASTVVAGRFNQPTNTPLPDTHHERGTGLLRRLSLSSAAFAKPQLDNPQFTPTKAPPSPPPNTAVSPSPKSLPFPRDTKPRRSVTVSVDGGKPRRAPSPMGERILKGHFDGFN